MPVFSLWLKVVSACLSRQTKGWHDGNEAGARPRFRPPRLSLARSRHHGTAAEQKWAPCVVPASLPPIPS